MKTIPLTRGKVAFIDDNDFEAASAYKWRAQFSSCNGLYYAVHDICSSDGRRRISLHRLLMGTLDGFEIDHADCDGLNCQRSNLRWATRSQNSANRRRVSRNTSGFKGVDWHKRRNAWRARITIAGKRSHLGYFDRPEEASRAYDAAARRLHGDFARINHPLEGERAA